MDRLADDPAFAPAALASEEDAMRGYGSTRTPAAAASSASAPAGGFDVRLRPWGSAAIAAWAGTLLGVALTRQYRRRKHGG